MASFNINEFRGSCPFEGLDKDEDFTPIETLKGKEVEITGVVLFENQKGPGASIRYKTPNGDRYFTTHAVGIVKIAGKINEMVDFGTDTVTAKVVYRKSQSSDNMVYALE